MDPIQPQFDYTAAPIYNQSQPLFGASATTPNVDAGASDFGFDGFNDSPLDFHFDDFQDSTDPKRRRIARACDACRRKKIKCDGKLPACTHCQNYRTECVFTRVEKKRVQPKGAKYIEGLENRLGRMEQLLRMSGLLDPQNDSISDLRALEQRLVQQGSPSASSNHSKEPAQQRRRSHHSPRDAQPELDHSTTHEQDAEEPSSQVPSDQPEVEEIADLMCSLVTNNQGETRFIGSSSSFSILSPKGLQWISEKTGDNSFQQLTDQITATTSTWSHWRPDVFDDILHIKQYTELPPREECMTLIKDLFLNFNRLVPLFHERTFMWLVDRQYNSEPSGGSGWWASLNVALAIAYRMRVMKSQEPDCETKSWAYFKNALAALPQLMLRNTDLLSVQALAGMVLFLGGSPNPQPVFQISAVAVRAAQAIGLHKRSVGLDLNEVEIEQRKRVFWIVYMMDKDQSIRSGRPGTLADDDWNTDLPAENPPDGYGIVEIPGKGKMNYFRQLCKFCIIIGKVYNKLYTVKASRQSDGELLDVIGELDQELEDWKDEIPLEFRPEHEIVAPDEATVLNVVMLHFSYYNTLATIHRMSIHHGYWTSRLSDYAIKGLNVRPLNARVYSSAAICVSAARAMINLLKYIPPQDHSCVWLILYYPMTALITLFANILQNPQDPRARSDLKLVGMVADFFRRMQAEDVTHSVDLIVTFSNEFYRIADIVLTKAEKEMNARQKKRALRETEKVERTEEYHHVPHDNLKLNADKIRQEVNELNRPQPLPAISRQPTKQAKDSSISPNVAQTEFSATAASPLPPNLLNPVNGSTPSETDYLTRSSSDVPTSENSFPSANTPMALDGSNLMNTSTDAANLTDEFYSSLGINAFQQPFLPQDMWNMPASFPWDLANFAGTADNVFSDAGAADKSNHGGATFG